ncbi:carbamoyltransferase family protein [Spirochaeta africana]|uniref:Putative carbamoyl transferase, NodU family n=1 Tax=Spirochaeta africana (strain ATCC 700263 / DSM 8902 / Z-7692) TaxID=889378 RepID=H9ULJ3_SPIAZ|nr:carbamoyltransferase [Spirochaeta africana]AFG38386.1 putative carbamoyl transferase, NodU family [Spirochaeta africana DSM 8902]
MRILGISAFYHDSAAALIEDGRIVAAAQEERFSRRKGDAGFPAHAVDYCLSEAGITTAELDAVCYYDKPIITFERLLSSYLHRAPFGLRSFLKAMPVWFKQKLWMEDVIRSHLPGDRQINDRIEILFARHHHSHAASAFYPSPFEHAAVVTLDGVGEWDTTTIGRGSGTSLQLERSIHFPHSLGLYYSAFTYYCGFKVNSGEYKLMGLAPYGTPRYAQQIRDHILQLAADGSFTLNQRYFNYVSGLKMINRRFEKLFGAPALPQGAAPTPFYMDIAASAQVVLEEAVLAIARHARELTGERYLVLAGGVALNSVANFKLLQQAGFDDIWIQPAAGDAGGAVGAALYAAHALHSQPRPHLNTAPGADHPVYAPPQDGMNGGALGPHYREPEAASQLDSLQAVYTRLPDDELFRTVAEDIANGRVVGWFDGRMEFGPRALGRRSILGDARSPEMQRTMNLKIKFREGFRPFAPVVAASHTAEWFNIDRSSPYMLLVCPVAEGKLLPAPAHEPSGFERLQVSRSQIPAVTHVDSSARIQTVHPETNPRFAALLQAFYELTGCPVMINTSFNVRGEPIVCRPEDAYRCFLGTDMDALVVGNLYLRKQDQPGRTEFTQELLQEWRDSHVID